MDFTGILDLWVKLITAGTAAACLVALVITGFELWRMPEKLSPGRRRSLRRYMTLSFVMALLCLGSAWFVARWNERRIDEIKKARDGVQDQLNITRNFNKRVFQRFEDFEKQMKERDALVKKLSEELLVLAKAGKLNGQDYSSVAQKLTILNHDSEAMEGILASLRVLKGEHDAFSKETYPPPAPPARETKNREPTTTTPAGEAAPTSPAPVPPASAVATPTEDPKDQPKDAPD